MIWWYYPSTSEKKWRLLLPLLSNLVKGNNLLYISAFIGKVFFYLGIAKL